MKVADIMTEKLVTVREDTPLDECIRLLEKYRIRHLLVTDEMGKLLGIISERDIRSTLPSREIADNNERVSLFLRLNKAADCMVKKPFTVSPDTPIRVAAQIMSSRKFGCLPVVDNGKVVGVITTTDLLEYLVSILEKIAA